MTEVLLEKKIITPAGYKHKCTNCMSCYNICPVGAIEIIEDKDGFAYPSIIEDKCTHCGLCSKKCPALNLDQTKEISERLETPFAFGGYIKDEEVRKNSSSGGVFSALAKYIFNKGGYVCGARFTRGGICEHVIVDNWEDLAPLRGSKYVQSNINNCFKEIKSLLEQDKYVLFTGTPCQVAGLYSVLGKDYEKLVTVDLLCHGTPSQKVFREYLNELTDGYETEVKELRFRDKKEGWKKPVISFHLNGHCYYYSWSQSYIQGFLNNLTLRKSCTDCRYTAMPRKGDFSIGDFWGVGTCDKQLDDDKGTSIVLINSQKALDVFTIVKDEFAALKEVSLKDAKVANEWSFSHAPIHPHSAYFLDKYSKGNYSSLSKLIQNALDKQDGIALLNFSESKINYGCLLTSYALQYKIRKYGYRPVNICFYDNYKMPDISNLGDFQRENIDITASFWSQKELQNLNKYFNTFITGSDCVWFDFANGIDFDNYKFKFVDFSKNICSYAASFLSDKLQRNRKAQNGFQSYTFKELKETRRLLKRFKYISVREDTGVKICKTNFDIDATHVLDPVFFLTQDEWISIAQNRKQLSKEKRQNHFSVSYLINMHSLDKDIINYIQNRENIVSLYDGQNMGAAIADAKNAKVKGVDIENWIESIANSDFVFTDSYHGMCFAIIFNKPFVVFSASEEGFNRHRSLLAMLGISNRRAFSVEDIERFLNEPIDYEKVNAKLQEHLKTSEAFLEKILYSHEHSDQVRSYMESLELLVDEKMKQKNVTKIVNAYTPPYPNKQKWYFLGIHVFKISMRKGEKWFYLFGIPLIKEIKKEYNTYYNLFGFIRVFKKAVRY